MQVNQWQYHNVLTAHNNLVADKALQFDQIVEAINNVSDPGYNSSATMGPETTSYTSMVCAFVRMRLLMSGYACACVCSCVRVPRVYLKLLDVELLL